MFKNIITGILIFLQIYLAQPNCVCLFVIFYKMFLNFTTFIAQVKEKKVE